MLSNTVVFVTLLAPWQSLGDLGAGVRRSHHAASLSSAASAPLSGSVMIPLSRVGAQHHAAAEASFYVGEISIGNPKQNMRVVFDTSSGHVLLPHRACKSLTCMEHHRYSPWSSSTAMDVNLTGEAVQLGQRLAVRTRVRDGISIDFTQSDLGSGRVDGVFVRDHICMGDGSINESVCVDVAVVAATNMDEKPFRRMPSDGIVGLGLEGLSASPLASFFGRVLEGSAKVVPHFGLAFGRDRGELHLGGHDLARLAAPLRWFPVDHSEAGFWQVAIQGVYAGNTTVNSCLKGCHGVIDSAVSRLGVQAGQFNAVMSALTSHLADDGTCRGPALTFDLGGMSLTLEAGDYAGEDCTPLLGSLELEEPEFVGVYAFGATVLRRYYAAFDWEHLKLGFAPLSGDLNQPSARSRSIPDDLMGVLLV